jgi:hypothetical protein
LEDYYGLRTGPERQKSILDQILTCKHPKQLEYVVSWMAKNIEYPQPRTYKRWLKAIAFKQKELGVQVLITDEEMGGDVQLCRAIILFVRLQARRLLPIVP